MNRKERREFLKTVRKEAQQGDARAQNNLDLLLNKTPEAA